jgi:paraquat-inducible protein B
MKDEREKPDDGASQERLPDARVRHHVGFSWIWLLPAGALALVGYLLYTIFAERGPSITLSFKTAEGLIAQQTQVKYKAVTLGTVDEINLSDDASRVIVTIRMTARAKPLLTESARFWVVRPRLSGGLSAFQSGLETLVSGAYVAIDPGTQPGAPKRSFEGLEEPPSIRSNEPGTVYFLEGSSLGGLSSGAPVSYREVSVGEVLSSELEHDRPGVKLRIFVQAPYDRVVVPESRFWNSSGIRVDTGAEGLRIELESARSLLSGGVAFGTPAGAEQHPPSKPESTFRLYASEAEAKIEFYGRVVPYVSYFQASVRGLAAGSEVHMFGQPVGSVTGLSLAQDPQKGHDGEVAVRVAYVLQPERMLDPKVGAALDGPGVRALVQDHLRVVLETTSFLTGQKALSLEYDPGSHAAPVVREGEALVLPSEAQDFQAITTSLAAIANKVNQIPFAEIGANLDRTLASLQRTVGGPELRDAIVSLGSTLNEVHELARQANQNLGPALSRLPGISEQLEHAVARANAAFGQSGYGSDSEVQRNLTHMMTEVADAARSLRMLVDYVDRHPEALVRGRKAGEP